MAKKSGTRMFSTTDRAAISRRMKRYWAKRRRAKKKVNLAENVVKTPLSKSPSVKDLEPSSVSPVRLIIIGYKDGPQLLVDERTTQRAAIAQILEFLYGGVGLYSLQLLQED